MVLSQRSIEMFNTLSFEDKLELASKHFGHFNWMTYRLVGTEPDGHVFKDTGEVPMRSWVANYAIWMKGQFNNQTTNDSMTDTGGSARTTLNFATGINSFNINDGAADSTFGPVVGSSSTAVTRTDTKLTTQITHGAAAGNLSYGATTVNTVTNPSGTTSQFTFTRVFTGNVGSTVNIQELAIYAKVTSQAWIFCIAHDLQAFGAVANGQNVTYTGTWSVAT